MKAVLLGVYKFEFRAACHFGGWCDVWADRAALRIGKLSGDGGSENFPDDSVHHQRGRGDQRQSTSEPNP